ncbi:MAG: hypothetical protein ACD_3C00001G0014 [uncultured bacterium (gcode 4)]|uniref:Nicotinic acid mononucleotide adenyltransferase n=1 Tax=uncultured bacterium (gcode 4) TaxID=1234023 RepID=K2G0V2_9BACT|nr:MAG: hypothetical protein ACD_3C00001G0014 [uncultured bacterium (gcode 4)]
MKNDLYYTNGQKISEQNGDILTYYFKTGKIKAKWKSINGIMDWDWIFNRESGELWQIWNFMANEKHGEWIRYGREWKIEYHALFNEGKIVRKIK